MESLFEGQNPSPENLFYWSYYNLKVIGTTQGYAYQLSSGGYMTQFAHKSYTVNKINIVIDYENSSEETILGEILLEGNDDISTSIALFLPSSGKRATLEFAVEVATIDMETCAIEIRTSGGQTLLIYGMQITAEVQESNQTVSTGDFQKYAILYGLDANKPRLEVISNEGNLL